MRLNKQHVCLFMQIRFSPYNSPFIPAGSPAGIHWIGLEDQFLIREGRLDAHVQQYWLSLPKHKRVYPRYLKEILLTESHKAVLNKIPESEYQELLTNYLEFGVQAAGRRLGLVD